MLEAIRNKRDRDEGFTLIELMVVVLIIAILVAIAVPTFLGARTRSQQKAAQSGARNALVAAKVKYTDTQSFATADATALAAIERDLTFVATGTASTGPKVVSVNPVSATMWRAAVLSADGSCYFIEDDQAASGNGTRYAKDDTSPTCTGTQATSETFTETGWD